jgi:hypothetical protein
VEKNKVSTALFVLNNRNNGEEIPIAQTTLRTKPHISLSENFHSKISFLVQKMELTVSAGCARADSIRRNGSPAQLSTRSLHPEIGIVNAGRPKTPYQLTKLIRTDTTLDHSDIRREVKSIPVHSPLFPPKRKTLVIMVLEITFD